MQLKQKHPIFRKSSIGKTLSFIVGLGVFGFSVPEAKAQIFLDSPTATFGPGNTLTGYTVTVGSTAFGRFGPLPAGTNVTLQYQDNTGAAIGGPITTTLGAGGLLSVPPPPIPAGAVGLDNQVVITDVLTGVSTKPLIWYNSAWFWGVDPDIKIDPLGIPGITTTQSWFLDEVGLELTSISDVLGTVTSTVIDSNFDLQYTDLGGNLFEAEITGDNSFIKLANDTHISFSDGLPFGMIEIDFNDGVTANGTFDFSAIGLAGIWDWLASTNYTGGTGNPSSGGFDAPAISVVSVPEGVSPIAIIAVGSLGVSTTLLRKKKLKSEGFLNRNR